jgi:mono/diheme cytochrome c family protein
MPAFGALSDHEVGLVLGFLAELCPPGVAGGADLYRDNCATRHGADAGGQGDAPNVRCATRVADALDVGRAAAMPAFPLVTPAQCN